MPINYAEIRDDADDAILDAGQPGYIRRTATGAGADPWNPGSGTATDYPIVFVLVDYAERDRDGTLVQQNDQKAIIKAGGLSITANDTDQLVDSSGNAWEIVAMRPLAPGGISRS